MFVKGNEMTMYNLDKMNEDSFSPRQPEAHISVFSKLYSFL